jgi:transglutaminase-like putative cysteine protease
MTVAISVPRTGGFRHLVPDSLGTTTVAMLTAWFALWTWRGLIEHPQHFLGPALTAGLLLVLAGSVARSLRVPAALVPLVEVVVVGLFVNHHYAAAASWHHVVPTRASLVSLVDTAVAGAGAINKYTSPVPARFDEAYLFLLVCSIGIMLAVDLLACGLRRVPLAGLPVLLALTIPISILDSGLSWPIFVVTALLYLLLVSTEQTRRVLAWGRSVAGTGRRWDSLDQAAGSGSIRSAALRIGLLAIAGALVLPALIPVTDGIFGKPGSGGIGNGPGGNVVIQNPIVDLRRDLVQKKHVPLVYAQTTDPDTSYLRLAVLDEYTGNEWKPSPRHLPAGNRADGTMPEPPGLFRSVPGSTAEWSLSLAPSFDTRWLPTPYPVRRLQISGDWRYDSRTLDIVDADAHGTVGNTTYRLTAFHPELSAIHLDDSLSAPGDVQGPMTSVPTNLPPVIAGTALRVTRKAQSPYARAVALQDWFRNGGGFTYSTARRPGSGMSELAAFITHDKVGFCEQFAAAMAVMGRTLGIPSRVVVGFLHPQRAGSPDSWVYTTDDLHAWPEMYFNGYGWVVFDPTPAVRSGAAPAYTRQQLPVHQPSPTAVTHRPKTHQAPKQEKLQQPPTTAGSGSSPLLWLPVGAGVLLLLLLSASPRLLRDARRRTWLRPGQDAPGLAAGTWAELHATVTDLGLPWPFGRSARETGRVLARHLAGDDRVSLEELVGFVERARYARPFELGAEEERQVVGHLEVVTTALTAAVSPRRRRLAALFPPSVLRRQLRAPAAVAEERTEVGV